MHSLVLATLVSIIATSPAERLPLVLDGEPSFVIQTAAEESKDPVIQRAAAEIAGTVQRWASAEMKVVVRSEARGLPDEAPAIVLSTLGSLRKMDSTLEARYPAVLNVGFLEPDGFAIVPVEQSGVHSILVTGRTPRGVYNGAVHLTDFLIDGPADALHVKAETVVKSPRMEGRAVYTLTIWGNEAEYTAADWETIFDSFARDGFDRIYFWVSGHFPSKLYPQTYKCRDGDWDTTEKTRIGTIEDLQRIIRAAHDRGMKLYLGSALGGWCGTLHLTKNAPGTMKAGSGIAPRSLCPSHPDSRKALVAYHKEMFDALSKADGLYIESADEWGGCHCEMCAKPVDDRGSRQFGQSQLTLLQEIMSAVWEKNPHARCAYTIGYAEHKSDPAYYDQIKQMSDPRMEWMEARDSWEFPGLSGKAYPVRTFSDHVMRWRQYYTWPLENLVTDANRAISEGLHGLITAFEPGFGTGSFYRDIPFPTGEMPYVLTGFAFREMTWQPMMTEDDLRERTRLRFFGDEGPMTLVDAIWRLRQMIIDASKKPELSIETAKALSQIEARVQKSRVDATPKMQESLDLMDRGIRHIREHAKAAE